MGWGGTPEDAALFMEARKQLIIGPTGTMEADVRKFIMKKLQLDQESTDELNITNVRKHLAPSKKLRSLALVTFNLSWSRISSEASESSSKVLPTESDGKLEKLYKNE